MVTLGLLFALSLAQGQKISVNLDAMSAEKALQQVGAAANLSLTVSPQTAHDVLLLRFKDVPVQEAMRRIAMADDASWKQEGSSYRLIRTSDQRRTEEEKELKEDIDSITKAISKRVGELAKLPPWSADQADQLASKVAAHLKSFNPQSQDGKWYARSNQLSDQAPFGRAMVRVLASIDPKDLAQLSRGIKTVWSTNPTRTQLPMPQQVVSVINQFIRDNADWSAAVQKWQLKPPTFGNTTYWVGGFGDFSSSEATASNVAVVLLTAFSYGMHDSFQLELSAYDSNGKKIASSESNLSSSNYPELLMEEKPVPAGERAITMTSDAQAIAATERTASSAKGARLPADVLGRLVDTERNEPLNFVVGSALKQAADIKGVNLAARLCDQMGTPTLTEPGKTLSADRLLALLTIMGGQSEIKDGWLMVQPSRPAEASQYQVDRRELGKYLRLVASGKHIALDEQAAFALSLPDQEDNTMPQMFANVVNPKLNDEYADRNMLKIYGLMTPEQKSRMLGEGCPCGSLDDRQKECLNRMVYGQFSNFQYMPPPNQRGARGVDMDLFYNGIMHEPTESMPNGVPPGALIRLVENNSYVVVTGERMMQQYVQPGQEMDAGSLAWQKYSQEHPNLFPWMTGDEQKLNLDNLKYGQRLQMNFTFQLTQELSMTESLEDKDMGTFQSTTMADLPADFKKAYQTAYDSYAKSYANMKPGQFAGPPRNTNIPPIP